MASKLVFTFLAGGAAAMLLADVQYEQTSKVTGGSMVNIPIVGGKLKEPSVTKHIYKGNRMAVIMKDNVMVYDLDKETVTTIHKEKREYSVMTFAEMREAMDKSMQRMQQATQSNGGEMTWSVKVDDAGESKNINGFDAKKFIVTVDGVTTEKKSGKTIGSRMEMETWIAKDVPGASEINAFTKKMGEKFGAGRVSGIAPMVQAQMGKGWYEAAKEFAKMEGFNVMTVTKMSSTVDGKPMMVPEGQQSQGPNAGDVAKDAATSEAMSRIGGRLGGALGSGIGGLGRRKKSSSNDDAKPAAASGDGKMVPTTTMEMTMEVGSISRYAADAAEMNVPAGFKQVESEMKRMLK